VPALDLVQSTPDAVRFAGRDRELEALLPDDALRTDGFRARFTLKTLVPRLEVGGGEKQIGVGSAAPGIRLPIDINIPGLTHRDRSDVPALPRHDGPSFL
jgi:hypothetical protein